MFRAAPDSSQGSQNPTPPKQSVFAQIRTSIETGQRFQSTTPPQRFVLPKTPRPLTLSPPPTLPSNPPASTALRTTTTKATTTTTPTRAAVAASTSLSVMKPKDNEVEVEEKTVEKKMDKIIKMMKGIMTKDKKVKSQKTKTNESPAGLNLEDFVRQVVTETLAKSKKIIMKEQQAENGNKGTANALDAILNNLLLDRYPNNKSEESLSKVLKEIKNIPEENPDQTNEDQTIIDEDTIDEIVERLFPILQINKDLEEAEEVNDTPSEEKKEDFDVVHRALTHIFGDQPSEEEKLTPEVFAAVLELDEFLRDEEEALREQQAQVDDLLSSALDYVDTAVSHREDAARLLEEPRNNKNKAHSKIKLSPSILAALLSGSFNA